jgi:hypothetical protein
MATIWKRNKMFRSIKYEITIRTAEDKRVMGWYVRAGLELKN